MSGLPRTVKHRYTGESITFVETAEETHGKYLLIEVALPPQGMGPPLHRHDRFTESFEVIEGRLTVIVGEEEHILAAGQTIHAPIGIAHTFVNRHDEAVVFWVKLEPPLQFEQSVRIHYGLMNDGLTDDKGVPRNLFHVALILVLQNTLIADQSPRIQRAVFGLLTRIGSWTKAYKPLEKYIGGAIRLR